ncbi:MAG: transposase [Candidatus Binatia bacterium]
MSLPDVVQRFKSLTTARYRKGVTERGWPGFYGRLWQRNYYEHVIRGGDELDRIRRYIEDNRRMWEMDRENPVAQEARGQGIVAGLGRGYLKPCLGG